jgi:hypothetical protein
MPYTETEIAISQCPESLSAEHFEQYREIGCIAFENVLTPDEVEATRTALSEITRRLMQRAHRGEAELKEQPNATKNYAGIQITNPDTGFGIHFEAGLPPKQRSLIALRSAKRDATPEMPPALPRN